MVLIGEDYRFVTPIRRTIGNVGIAPIRLEGDVTRNRHFMCHVNNIGPGILDIWAQGATLNAAGTVTTAWANLLAPGGAAIGFVLLQPRTEGGFSFYARSTDTHIRIVTDNQGGLGECEVIFKFKALRRQLVGT